MNTSGSYILIIINLLLSYGTKSLHPLKRSYAVDFWTIKEIKIIPSSVLQSVGVNLVNTAAEQSKISTRWNLTPTLKIHVLYQYRLFENVKPLN